MELKTKLGMMGHAYDGLMTEQQFWAILESAALGTLRILDWMDWREQHLNRDYQGLWKEAPIHALWWVMCPSSWSTSPTLQEILSPMWISQCEFPQFQHSISKIQGRFLQCWQWLEDCVSTLETSLRCFKHSLRSWDKSLRKSVLSQKWLALREGRK